jgi:hypothetical protein
LTSEKDDWKIDSGSRVEKQSKTTTILKGTSKMLEFFIGLYWYISYSLHTNL